MQSPSVRRDRDRSRSDNATETARAPTHSQANEYANAFTPRKRAGANRGPLRVV